MCTNVFTLVLDVEKKAYHFIERFFKSENERTLNLKRNIVFSFLVKIFSVLTSLLLVPLTINFVNPMQYGIWITLSSIIGWFTFFDFGLTNGLRNKITEAKANGHIFLCKIYVSTIYVILTLFFFLFAIVAVWANNYIHWSSVLNIDEKYNSELLRVFNVVIVFFCLQMILRIISTLLQADQKPAIASFIDLVGQIGILILIYLSSLWFSGSLFMLASIVSVIPVLILLIVSFYLYRKRYRAYIPSLKYVKLRYAKDIMGMGGKFFFIQISWILIFQCTNIILLRTTDGETVTLYNILYKYYNAQLMIFSIVLGPYWSAFTEAYVKEEYLWMENSYKKLKKMWSLFSIWIVFTIIISPIVFHLWIGESIQIPIAYSMAMGVYTIIMIKSNLNITLIAGIGKISMQVLIDVFLALVSIPLLLILCEKFGILGVIFASILMPLSHSILGDIQLNKILSRTAKGVWSR